MTKTEMLEILRGKVLTESPEEIQSRLNEIADELEQSERVVHGHWEYVDTHLLLTYHRCSECGNVTDDYIVNKQTFQHDKLYYCPNCGAKMDEHFADIGKKVDEVGE